MKRLYRHGQIASEESATLVRADVLVEGDRIIGVAPEITAGDDMEIIECEGRILLPALFDVHVHAREPGREDKETIQTCSEAAINGGITGMVLQPNTTPAIDTAGLVRTVLEIGKAKSRIAIFTTGAITKGRKGEELAEMGELHAAGCLAVSDDGKPVMNASMMRRA